MLCFVVSDEDREANLEEKPSGVQKWMGAADSSLVIVIPWVYIKLNFFLSN